MKTIDEIQSELRALALELEQLKQSNDAAENLTADFKKLSANGYRYPITPHPLESFDEHASKCYLTVLLTVAQFEPEMLSESLLLAHRIAFGMNYLGEGDDLQEEFAAAQTLTFSQLDEITSLFRETDERLMLILECLLTAGAFDKGRQEAFKYIAELAVLLNVDKEQLVFLSNMAAVILTKNLDYYRCNIRNKYNFFNCYLHDVNFNRNIIKASIPERIESDTQAGVMTGLFSVFNSGPFYKCEEATVTDNKIIYKCQYTNRAGLQFPVDIEQEVDGVFYLLEPEIKPGTPVGIQTHYLDSPETQQNYFESKKDKERPVRKK